MANSIDKGKAYVPILDTIYKAAAKTAILDIAPALVKAGNTAGSFLLPQMNVVGLGDYSRADGFKAGDVDFTWVEYTYTQDRGRRFTVDAVDDLETAGQAFGSLAGEFIRTQVVPEIDAYRLSKLAAEAGAGTDGIIADAEDAIAALNEARNELEEAEVDTANMVLFITPTVLNLAKNASLLALKCPLLDEATVVSVPQSRMVSEIELDAGSNTDEGGWAKALGADDLNFILMDKSAAFTDAKHDVPRVFDPSTFQAASAWAFDYRIYHDTFVKDNKRGGIYVHTAAVS